MKTEELTPIAQAIIDGYWTLCSGSEAIQYAIEDYLDRDETNEWSPDGETPVTPQEFLTAIVEAMNFFEFTSVKDEVVVKTSRIEGLVSAIRRHPVSRKVR